MKIASIEILLCSRQRDTLGPWRAKVCVEPGCVETLSAATFVEAVKVTLLAFAKLDALSIADLHGDRHIGEVMNEWSKTFREVAEEVDRLVPSRLERKNGTQA